MLSLCNSKYKMPSKEKILDKLYGEMCISFSWSDSHRSTFGEKVSVYINDQQFKRCLNRVYPTSEYWLSCVYRHFLFPEQHYHQVVAYFLTVVSRYFSFSHLNHSDSNKQEKICITPGDLSRWSLANDRQHQIYTVPKG